MSKRCLSDVERNDFITYFRRIRHVTSAKYGNMSKYSVSKINYSSRSIIINEYKYFIS